MDPYIVANNISMFGSILQTVSIMLGLGLFMGGLFQLKRYGEMRTFMSTQMTIAVPLSMMISGTALLALPTTIATALNAFWSTTSPLNYGGSGYGWDQYVPAVVMFVRVIGVGSFMRGLLLFSRTGHQAQPGTLSKAMLHLVGGVLCIHIIGTVDLLKSILDID